MIERAEITAGKVFEVPYPFKMGKFTEFDECGSYVDERYVPGFYIAKDDDDLPAADAMGAAIYEVVSIHKPGKYLDRVFYTRRWRCPEGICFGGGRLMACSITKFRKLLKGCAYGFNLDGVWVHKSSAVATLVGGEL